MMVTVSDLYLVPHKYSKYKGEWRQRKRPPCGGLLAFPSVTSGEVRSNNYEFCWNWTLKTWSGVVIAGVRVTPVTVVLLEFVPSVYWIDVAALTVPARLTELLLPATTVLSWSSAYNWKVTGLPLTWKPLMPTPKLHVIVQLWLAQLVVAGVYFVPFR